MAVSKVILNGTTLIDVTDDTVNASNLLSGITATRNDGVEVTGTYTPPTASLQAKTNIAPTTSSQTITPDTGYDGLSSVQINAMPSGSVTVPSSIIAGEATLTPISLTSRLQLSKTVSVTPTVTTAGYVSAGTAGNIDISLYAEHIAIKEAETFTPSTSTISIRANTYLTGMQTILGDANLTAGNIKKDVSIFNIVGTYEGGGGATDITVTIVESVLDSELYLPPSASRTTDPDEPWKEYITIPANSMLCLKFLTNPASTLGVSGATYTTVAGALSRGYYFVFVYLGTTNATISY